MVAPYWPEAVGVELEGVGDGSGYGCGRDLGCDDESLSLRPDVEVVCVNREGEASVVDRSRACATLLSAELTECSANRAPMGSKTHLHRHYPLLSSASSSSLAVLHM